MNELVSVIIPVYNREKTVLRAIDSVLSQTYKNVEIIVIDDGSTDNTENVINKIESEKIRYLKNEVNKGVAYSRNNGLKNAQGEYIAFLDSDDYWYPFHLKECIEAIEKNEYSICSSLWDENYYGKAYNICQSPYFKKTHRDSLKKELNVSVDDELWLFPESFYEYILKTDFYCYQINTIVMKKGIIDDIGFFDERFRASEDMDLCYRIFRKYPLLTINKSHFSYNYGYDNLWAFADREKDLRLFTDEEKNKMRFTTNQKIFFYKTLLERTSVDDCFLDKQSVLENICSNIVKRYLTLNFLFNCRENVEEINKYSICDKIKELENYDLPEKFLILD